MAPLSAAELKNLQAALLQRRDVLLDIEKSAADAAGVVELDQQRVGRLSRMDALQGQAMSAAAKQRRDNELQRIATALKRIQDDEYGYCLRCEEEIATARLHADPTATLCITCAGKAESAS